MKRDVRVLFLHGIRKGPQLDWVDALNDELTTAGRSPIKKDDVVAPDYSAVLRKGTYTEAPAPLTRPLPSDRREFVGRQATLQRSLGQREPVGRRFSDEVVVQHVGRQIPVFDEARNFAKVTRHPEILDVVNRTLEDPRGDWVVVAHSLGTAVALELMTQLPPGMKVRQLITVASPLGREAQFGRFVKEAAEYLDFGRLGTWINVYNVNDVVAGARGLYSTLPFAINVPLRGQQLDHSIAGCFTDPRIIEQLGDALFGVRARGVALRSPEPEREWDRTDLLALMRLQYLWRAQQMLLASGDKSGEEGGARAVQIADLISRSIERGYAAAHRPPPTASLRGDLSGQFGADRVPAEAIAGFLITLAVSDPFDPYEINLGKRSLQVQKLVAQDFGLVDAQVIKGQDALKDAGRAFRELPFGKLATIGGIAVGAVLVAIVAPWAVAAIAPAGLAGGAAVLGGLAALGPGGLAGGIALLAAGGASIGGLASAAGATLVQSSSVAIRAEAIQLMASALLADQLRLANPTHSEWQILASAYAEAENEALSIVELSDRGSDASKEAKAKVETLRKALDWMSSRGLSPLQITAGVGNR